MLAGRPNRGAQFSSIFAISLIWSEEFRNGRLAVISDPLKAAFQFASV